MVVREEKCSNDTKSSTTSTDGSAEVVFLSRGHARRSVRGRRRLQDSRGTRFSSWHLGKGWIMAGPGETGGLRKYMQAVKGSKKSAGVKKH